MILETGDLPAVPSTGLFDFASLCQNLIEGFGGEEQEEYWLYPEVARTRSTDWMAHIWTRPPGDERRVKLASAQADTMEEACARCVADYHERRKIEARKEELLKEPLVREALELFKSNVSRQESTAGEGRL